MSCLFLVFKYDNFTSHLVCIPLQKCPYKETMPGESIWTSRCNEHFLITFGYHHCDILMCMADLKMKRKVLKFGNPIVIQVW